MAEGRLIDAVMSFLLVAVSLPASGRGAATGVWPGEQWETATPEQVGMDSSLLTKGRDHALTGSGSGIITRFGKVVLRWGDPKQTYDLKSSTKAIGVTAVGLALLDGKFQSLHDPAALYQPQLGVPPEENKGKGYLDKITLFHLATQTAGFDKNGGYTELLFEPGTKWSYSDGGPNWLAECVTLAYGRDLQELMFERVFSPIGIGREDLKWRANSYRPKEINGLARREFGSGIGANVEAMARIGYLYLRGGQWQDQRILPPWFVDAARTIPYGIKGLPVVRPESYGNASDHYGLLWWNNADGTMKNVPQDAYWSWGLYDSLIVVIPSLDVVIARAGKSLTGPRLPHYAPIESFIEPIVRSVQGKDKGPGAPYPASRAIPEIDWAPVGTIIRRAQGGDNWPITWADDGSLYTAYGDAQGFPPRVEKKLSLGLVKVTGGPEDFQGVNIRSSTGETVGEGARGAKASGMLCVKGILYMLVRNVGNSQVAWSDDHAVTWHRCDWKFETSFGAPTFLNFGANYTGRRDNYVYLYSNDDDSAYTPADRMVMARVPLDQIRERKAYEFFKAVDATGQPVWMKDIRARGAVFVNPGRCYRSGISYNAGLKRYLWCQILPFSKDSRGPRFQGGFGIYEAPEPWGPWRTVFFAETWDVGPGETSSFPTKWMSPDGRTCHLVFSGDDSFSVRRVELKAIPSPMP